MLPPASPPGNPPASQSATQAVDLDRAAGVFAAVLTPFDETGRPMPARWRCTAAGCWRAAARGCRCWAPPARATRSLSTSASPCSNGSPPDGIPAQVLLPGTGCTAVADTVRLTERAVQLGAPGVLMLPPFYYKSVSDDGLFAAFAEVIERVGDSRLRIYLYNFPQMTGLSFGMALIERLLASYPATIAGMKDSSGDFPNMLRVAQGFAGFDVFTGSDEFLLPLLRGGGVGCITAVSNVAAPLAAQVYAAWRRSDGAAAEPAQAAYRRAQSLHAPSPALPPSRRRWPATPVAPGWRRLRPPLMTLSDDEATALATALDALGFAPPSEP